MISELKFFSELNFFLKNNEPFIVFKKPSHNKITCHQGTVVSGVISAMNGKKGFLFMPFNINSKGYLLTPKKTFETEFYLDFKINNQHEVSTKDFIDQKSSYINYVKRTIKDIDNSNLEKIVCSSNFSVIIDSSSIMAYFKNLLQYNNDAFCYLFFHPEIGIWMGASPEKLISLNKGLVTTYALAATKKEINQNWTDKEFREQKIVEEQITNDLSKYCNSIEKGALQTIKAGSIYHLKSVLKAKTKTHPFDLINILHPTPAVAGTPKKEAINYINEKENYDRSFYTGYMGIIDNYSCDIYVNIRCAKITDNNLSVYVGGGITRDSKPLDEWNEILNKSQTMLRVFRQV